MKNTRGFQLSLTRSWRTEPMQNASLTIDVSPTWMRNENGFLGCDRRTKHRRWSNPPSMWCRQLEAPSVFAFTIVFFPGYGHIYPKTFLGHAFTIVYNLIGLPLMMVFLVNIGDVMARALTYIYRSVMLQNLVLHSITEIHPCTDIYPISYHLSFLQPSPTHQHSFTRQL